MSLKKVVRFTLLAGFSLAVWNLGSTASAAPPAGVPEIDPSSAASALAVLTGGGLMLADRLGLRRR